MLELVNRAGVDLLVDTELEGKGLLVAFSGRQGGVSLGAFSDLNLSYSVGDTPKSVSLNRVRLAEAIEVPLDRWVLCRQVHGAVVREGGPLDVGRGARDFESGIPRTDGLATALGNTAVGVLSADCLPVTLVARSRPSVAVAHAGWRGVLAGTAVVALRKLAKLGECPASEVSVYIGPHIMACCMEADEKLSRMFRGRFGPEVSKPGGAGKTLIDLELACRRQLEAAGVARANIHGSGICTACGEGYFSFRGSGGTCGRQGAFASILGSGGRR